jgi:hypothetical protein
MSLLKGLPENELVIFQDVGETEEEDESHLQEEVMDLSALVEGIKIPEEMITKGRKLSLEKKTVLREISNLAILIEVAIDLQTITMKVRNLVEVINHTKIMEIIQVEDLTVVEEIIQVEDLTTEEGIILVEDLTVVGENLPTTEAAVNVMIVLKNLKTRVIETVVENLNHIINLIEDKLKIIFILHQSCLR